MKAAYSAPLCRYIAHHKTVSVAEVLLSNARTAQEVLTVQTLKSLRIHPAFVTLGKEGAQSTYVVMEARAKTFAAKLGFAVEEGESVWNCFPPYGITELALYEAVRGLSDHDLAQLQVLLAALSFGQENGDKLDTRDSFFNRVARDLSMDMRKHWRPDFSIFNKRNREQLVTIAKECGYLDGHGPVGSMKKSDLVAALVKHFENAMTAIDPLPSQVKAREWLPEAMLFPAVDPNGVNEAPEIDGDEGIVSD